MNFEAINDMQIVPQKTPFSNYVSWVLWKLQSDFADAILKSSSPVEFILQAWWKDIVLSLKNETIYIQHDDINHLSDIERYFDGSEFWVTLLGGYDLLIENDNKIAKQINEWIKELHVAWISNSTLLIKNYLDECCRIINKRIWRQYAAQTIREANWYKIICKWRWNYAAQFLWESHTSQLKEDFDEIYDLYTENELTWLAQKYLKTNIKNTQEKNSRIDKLKSKL